MDVVVIGGGITGLTAAWALGRSGIPVTLLEASDRLGGKVRTEALDGFLVEAGPDSFISYRPAAVELCRELGLAGSIIRPLDPRIVNVRTGGRFVRLPEGMGLVLPTRMRPFVTTPMFSLLEKARMGMDLVLPRGSERADVAVGPFLRRRLGRPLVDRLAGPLIGGVYGTPIDELSLDAVVPQLREAERDHRSLLLASLAQGRARTRAAGKSARRGASGGVGGGPGHGGDGAGAGAGSGGHGIAASPFVTLAGGTGQLADALVAALRAMPGVEIRTATPVTGLEPRGLRVDVRLEGGELLGPDVVILAAPAPVAAGLVEPIAPAAGAHLRSIPHGSTGVVSLGYRLDQFPAPPVGHGFLVADDEPLTINAGTLTSLKWAGRAPEGAVLIRAFMGSRQERLLASPDEAVAAAARHDLEATLGVRGEPILTRVARWTGAMPHYTVGHIARVDAAFAALAGVPGLVLAGSAYRGVGLPDCIAQGRAAAARAEELLAGPGGPRDAGDADSDPGVVPIEVETGASPVTLDRLATGIPARVLEIGASFRDELAAEGVRPGTRLSVTAVAPFGGPMVLDVGRARVAVARSVAATVHVAPHDVAPHDVAAVEPVPGPAAAEAPR